MLGAIVLPRPTRRAILAGGAAATLLPTGAAAADYPSRPIDFVIPFPPGGGSDVFGRIIAKGLETAVGQPVIPINKPGAGSLIGTNQVKNARADGYTLLFATTAFLINAVVREVNYSPTQDFQPIGMVGRATYVLVSSPKRGFRSVGELVAYGQAHPNELKFGSPGIGVSGQLAGDLLRHLGKVQFVDVRYKGSSEAVLAVMSGEVDFCFDSPAALISNVKAGRLQLLAGAGEKRDPIYPDIPTIAETLPGYAVWPWFGIVAPKATPDPVLLVLRNALDAMAQDQVMVKRLTDAGVTAFPMAADDFLEFITRDRARWTGIASRESG